MCTQPWGLSSPLHLPLLLFIYYMSSDTLQSPGRDCAPSSPTLPEVTSATSWNTPSTKLPSAGWQGQAGLQPREKRVSDRLGSPAGGQTGRWGG